MKAFTFPAVLALCIVCQPLLAQSPNIQGITLGIPIEKAVSMVGPGYDHWQTKSTDGLYTIAYEFKPHDNWVFQAMGDTVVYISRGIVFPAPNFPDVEPTRQRLFDKYSTPLMGTTWRWTWDEKEHLLNSRDFLRGLKCQNAFQGQPIRTPHDTIFVPKGESLSPDCSYMLLVNPSIQGTMGAPVTLRNITFALMDMRPFYTLAQKQAPAAAEKKRQEDARKPVVPF